MQMIEVTGCDGIAIGRGALANPWLYRQLVNWEQTGDPGPRGTYYERIDFMETHVRRLVEWRGDHFGCVLFRKISTWYARALRFSRDIQQRLVLLSGWDAFCEIVKQLRDEGPPAGWSEWDGSEDNIAVPAGPIAHW